jgi:hypothetical protein
MNHFFIPVMTGATESVTKGLKISVNNNSVDAVQKAAVLGTSHITRKVLQCET